MNDYSVKEMLDQLGRVFGSPERDEPVDITGDNYGSRTVRAMGMEGSNPMARVAVGLDREQVIAVFGVQHGNQDVYDYVDTTYEPGAEPPSPEGFRDFMTARLRARTPANIKYIISTLTEGGDLDPERPGFKGKPLGTNVDFDRAIDDIAQRMRLIVGALNKALADDAQSEDPFPNNHPRNEDHTTTVLEL